MSVPPADRAVKNGPFPELLCYALDMSDTQLPEPRASVTTADTKSLVRAIVGTGIGLATLLLMLVGLMFQQNANMNARIGDVNARVDDVNANMNARFDYLQDDIGELRAEFRSDIGELRAEFRSDIGELRAEFRSDIRELRDIVITALKSSEPAD